MDLPELPEPVYFYRVEEFGTSFKADPGKNEPLSFTKDFKGGNPILQREEANKYYKERLEGFKSASYFLPFAGPRDFIMGKNSAISLCLSLVEFYSEDDYVQHYVILPKSGTRGLVKN